MRQDTASGQLVRRRFGDRSDFRPEVEHSRHVHSVSKTVQRGSVAFRVRGQHDYPACSGDRVVIKKPLRGTRQHDAGQVVATKDRRLLISALRDNDLASANFHQAFRRDQGNPVVCVIAGGVRTSQQPYARIALHGCYECIGPIGGVRSAAASIKTAAARSRILVDEKHRRATLRRRQRSREDPRVPLRQPGHRRNHSVWACFGRLPRNQPRPGPVRRLNMRSQ